MSKRDEVIVAIDPGVDFGFAAFCGDRVIEYRSYSPDADKGWYARVQDACDTLDAILGRLRLSHTIKKGYCEMPGLFQSAGGQVTGTSGALVKLAFATGALCRTADAFGIEMKLMEVNTWKGQLPKAAVNRRLREILDATGNKDVRPTNHDWDAIGIGLFVLGRFED